MEDILGQSLAEQDSDKPEKVLPFKKDDNPA
jgi:hypothetical protein